MQRSARGPEYLISPIKENPKAFYACINVKEATGEKIGVLQK